MKNREKFSQKLEAAREKLRLTQPEMAELMGLKERQYIGYEKGEYDDNERLVAKYSNRLEEGIAEYEKQKSASFPQQGSADLKIAALEGRIKRLEDDVRELMRKH